MLDLAEAPLRVGGLVVFADHADPSLFYAVAESPRLVHAPDPRLSLVLFRGGASGGLLSMEITADPTDHALAEAAEQLSRDRPARIVTPDWRAARFCLAGRLADGPGLSEVYAGAPSLVGSSKVVVTARVDETLATLLARSFRGDAAPVVVLYTLETLGLAGPLAVEIEADMRAVHDALVALGALTTPVGRAQVRATLEALATTAAVKVRVLDLSGDPATLRAEALQRFGEDVVRTMLQPVSVSEAGGGLDPAIASVELQFKLSLLTEEQDRVATWNYSERAARAITHHAAASVTGMLGSTPGADVIRLLDLPSDAAQLVVTTTGSLAERGVIALTVDLLHPGPDGDVGRAVALSDAEPHAALTLPAGASVRWRATADFIDGTRRETAWAAAEGAVIVVEPLTLFDVWCTRVQTGRVDWRVVQRVEVEFRAGSAVRTVAFTGPGADRVTFFGEPRDGAAWSARVYGSAGFPDAMIDPMPLGDDVVIDEPLRTIEIFVIPVQEPDVDGVIVELEPAAGTKTSLVFEAPDLAARPVWVRVPRADVGAVRWRAVRTLLDGRVEHLERPPTTDRALVIGPAGVRAVRVELLSPPAARGFALIELRIDWGDARTEAILESDATSATLLVDAPGDAPWSLFVRGVREDGHTAEATLTGVDTLVVLPLDLP